MVDKLSEWPGPYKHLLHRVERENRVSQGPSVLVGYTRLIGRSRESPNRALQKYSKRMPKVR